MKTSSGLCLNRTISGMTHVQNTGITKQSHAILWLKYQNKVSLSGISASKTALKIEKSFE